ncbi:MAG: hypothetical protein LBQ88_03890 [Treponema sp.]|nr:hypothetical protein [Treponema sp.]
MASEVLLSISKDEIERARREGRQEEKIEAAGSLMAIGDPIEKIARVTGLSFDEIAKL